MAKATISACLVVYNEAKVIERCLASIKDLVDEIVVVHDGECSDETLKIAARYTDKIFAREHVGMMEGHLPFAFKQATGEWLLRIDADEYFDEADFAAIKAGLSRDNVDGFICRWEMWNGQRVVTFPGLQKMCFMRRTRFHYLGIPHESGTVDGRIEHLPVTLHHRPLYSNIGWEAFLKKTRKWVPVHAKYFFGERVSFDGFNTTPANWIKQTEETKRHILTKIIFTPLKMCLGQLKNGLWRSPAGWSVALQQYVYYLSLYRQVWKMQKQK
jgi:glycosyltransferase involved in cell wall biosynthesis